MWKKRREQHVPAIFMTQVLAHIPLEVILNPDLVQLCTFFSLFYQRDLCRPRDLFCLFWHKIDFLIAKRGVWPFKAGHWPAT